MDKVYVAIVADAHSYTIVGVYDDLDLAKNGCKEDLEAMPWGQFTEWMQDDSGVWFFDTGKQFAYEVREQPLNQVQRIEVYD